MRNREVVARLDARADERLAQMREAMERDEQRRDAAFNATLDSIREMTAEIRENTRALQDVQDGIKASNRGLLRVLDRLDDEFGPPRS